MSSPAIARGATTRHTSSPSRKATVDLTGYAASSTRRTPAASPSSTTSFITISARATSTYGSSMVGARTVAAASTSTTTGGGRHPGATRVRTMAARRCVSISQRYNENAFERVLYTESHDEVAQSAGQARVPELIWPGNAEGYFSQKRSTLGAALLF